MLFFDQQTAIIDQAIAKVDDQIKKLEEYRTAFISEYPSSLQHNRPLA
ncbi:hypothetical protein [Nostoc sp.]